MARRKAGLPALKSSYIIAHRHGWDTAARGEPKTACPYRDRALVGEWLRGWVLHQLNEPRP